MITSRSNPLIKEVKSLADKKFRDATQTFAVEGIKSVKEAIKANFRVKVILATKKGISALGENVPAEEVSESAFNAISDEKSPQGAIAVLFKPDESVKVSEGKCLVLDGVSDPANVGAIIRTAPAAGYKEIYLTDECADAFSPKAVRSSMGGIFKVKTMRGKRDEIYSAIRSSIYVADMNGEDAFSFKERRDHALVIGNEGHGVSNFFKEKAERILSVPMENDTESLNAAVAAGILMFALKR